MQKVTINKDALLAKIKVNSEAHKELLTKALKGYREDAIKELELMLAEARSGLPIRRSIDDLPEPVDHTEDYDRVVAMLEMSIEPVIELNQAEFDMYVRDKWQWKDMAFLTNMRYVK